MERWAGKSQEEIEAEIVRHMKERETEILMQRVADAERFERLPKWKQYHIRMKAIPKAPRPRLHLSSSSFAKLEKLAKFEKLAKLRKSAKLAKSAKLEKLAKFGKSEKLEKSAKLEKPMKFEKLAPGKLAKIVKNQKPKRIKKEKRQHRSSNKFSSKLKGMDLFVAKISNFGVLFGNFIWRFCQKVCKTLS